MPRATFLERVSALTRLNRLSKSTISNEPIGLNESDFSTLQTKFTIRTMATARYMNINSIVLTYLWKRPITRPV